MMISYVGGLGHYCCVYEEALAGMGGGGGHMSSSAGCGCAARPAAVEFCVQVESCTNYIRLLLWLVTSCLLIAPRRSRGTLHRIAFFHSAPTSFPTIIVSHTL